MLVSMLSFYITTISIFGGFLKESNYKSLGENLGDNVIITYDDLEIVGKSKSIVFLKNIFDKNKVVDFKTIHLGKSFDGNRFEVGDIITNKKIIRTTISVKNNKIVEIIFEDEPLR